MTIIDLGAAEAARHTTPSRERFERLYRTLRDRICLLEYPPGTRLSEGELAEEFAISRTPVRRARKDRARRPDRDHRHGICRAALPASRKPNR